MTQTRTHQSTSARGLNHDLLPMKLWQKAKKLGIWDPQDIDLTQDRVDWVEHFDETQRQTFLHLTAVFLGGEEAVTLDLLPLIMVIAKEGRLEEEMFLTSFLWEEAKHVEMFRRWLDEVAQTDEDLSHFYPPSYERLFFEELPAALNALRTDSSPEAQARASATYNMIVEGTLAETGYWAYLKILEAEDLMPGMREVVAHLNRDESRHIAYGVYLLSRLVAEHGEPVWEVIEERMGELLVPTMGIIDEIYDQYDPFPFDITKEDLSNYAMHQFQRRFERIAKAREQDVAQLERDAAGEEIFEAAGE